MASRRQRSGFVRAGEVDLGAGAMPARRARELRLARAWSEVAGEAVARHARALRVRRDVLEVAIDEPGWARALSPMLPVVAGRLAAAFPDLGVRRVRVYLEGSAGAAPPVAIETAALGGSEAAPSRRASEDPGRGGPPEIEDLARRYLERARRGKR